MLLLSTSTLLLLSNLLLPTNALTLPLDAVSSSAPTPASDLPAALAEPRHTLVKRGNKKNRKKAADAAQAQMENALKQAEREQQIEIARLSREDASRDRAAAAALEPRVEPFVEPALTEEQAALRENSRKARIVYDARQHDKQAKEKAEEQALQLKKQGEERRIIDDRTVSHIASRITQLGQDFNASIADVKEQYMACGKLDKLHTTLTGQLMQLKRNYQSSVDPSRNFRPETMDVLNRAALTVIHHKADQSGTTRKTIKLRPKIYFRNDEDPDDDEIVISIRVNEYYDRQHPDRFSERDFTAAELEALHRQPEVLRMMSAFKSERTAGFHAVPDWERLTTLRQQVFVRIQAAAQRLEELGNALKAARERYDSARRQIHKLLINA